MVSRVWLLPPLLLIPSPPKTTSPCFYSISVKKKKLCKFDKNKPVIARGTEINGKLEGDRTQKGVF